jgi:hypothetical protein
MAIVAMAVTSLLSAQDNAADPVPKGQRQRDNVLPQISVIDKLLSVESALAGSLNRSSEEQWAQSYQDLYQKFMRDGALSAVPGKGDDEVANALVLGIKASDAVLALKARNVEAMNLAAEQIDALARKLGATEAELGMANTVKKYARERRWLDAFMALGFLQRNILNYLRVHQERVDQAKMVIVGGWLQGGRCVTHVILENYGDLVSNVLREPRLVQMLSDALGEMKPEYKIDERMKKIMSLLPEIKKRVSVGFHEPVKKEDVEWLHKTFDELVIEITTGKAGSGAPAAAATPAAPGAVPVATPVQPK